MKKQLAVFALIMLALGVLATTASPKVFADWLIDGSGTLVKVDGAILGDDDVSDDAVATSNSSSETKSEAAKDQAEATRESSKDQSEAKREAEKQRLEKSRESLKNQVEARKKIQAKTGQTSKFELRSEDGKLKLKQEVKNAAGTIINKRELEMKDGEALHVEQEDGETAQINAVKDGEVEIIKNRIKAHSNLELKVGEKNDISVTLPNGKTRSISVPDQALEKLVANGVITPVEGQTDQFELTAGKNGEPVYETDGVVEKKFLGIPFLKLKFANKLQVAASNSEDGTVATGDIVNTTTQETSPFRRFLERLTR